MRNPTTTSAGAVANPGIAMNIGDKKSEIMNSTATVTAVSPVRPPSDTPAALSTKVVVVLVPNIAPIDVATASASNAPLIFGSFPFSSSMFAFVETPTNVPSVSNMSTKRNENNTTMKLNVSICEKSSLKNIGEILAGQSDAIPLGKCGNVENAPNSGLGT